MVVPASTVKLFDKNRIRTARQRAVPSFGNHDFLHVWTARQLADRLRDIKREPENAVLIGAPPTSALKAEIIQAGKIKSLHTMHDSFPADITGDAEFLPFADGSLDLVVSLLDLHSLNDLPGALIQIRRALKPDGLFLAAMPGGETLWQMRQSLMLAEGEIKGGASPRIHPFADKQQMGALLQRAGFALPVVDSEIVTVSYENIFRLMHDLRGMGESCSLHDRNRKLPGKALFLRTAQLYAEKFAETDGRIPASFEIIFLIGWAPHESQQKPLKPGAGQISLTEILGGPADD